MSESNHELYDARCIIDRNRTRQRWLIRGLMEVVLEFEQTPIELLPPTDPQEGITFRVPTSCRLGQEIFDGCWIEVDVIGPAGEVRWLEGVIEKMEIGAEWVKATVRLPTDPAL